MASTFGSDSTALNAVLKEHYPDGLPIDLVYKTSKLLGMLPKIPMGGFGEHHKIPVRVGNVVSTSPVIATALAASQAAPTFTAFEVLSRKRYTCHGITGEAMNATGSGGDAAFVDAVKEAVDSATYAHGRAISGEIFGDGSGTKGTVVTDMADGATTVVIKHREARNWEIGDSFSFYDPSTLGVITSGGAPHTVTAIERNLDVTAATPTARLTFAPAASAGTAVDAGDLLIKTGDLNAAMYGLEAWIPTVRTGLGTAFCGVTRSVDSQRLAGLSADLSSITSAPSQVVRALRLSADAGQVVDTAICSPSFFEEVSEALGAKDTRERQAVKSADGKYGYTSLVIHGGGAGSVNLVADPDCPDNRLYLLELSTWYIGHSSKGLPFMDDRDGNKFTKSTTADEMSFRLVHYGNLICRSPGRNASYIV